MHPLDGSRLKVRRAEEHLNALNQAVERFRQTNPYTFFLERQGDGPDYLLRAKINARPPTEWGIIVGDIAHNARSALDLLVFQFAVERRKRRRDIQFPIFVSHKKYLASNQRRRIAVLSKRQRAVIEQFQPYHRGKEARHDPLAILRDLNNSDKHRVVQLVGAAGHYGGLGIGAGSGGSVGIKEVRYSSIGSGVISEDGTPVARLRIILSYGQMNMSPKVSIDIRFGKGSRSVKNQLLLPTLALVLDRVKEVISEMDAL